MPKIPITVSWSGGKDSAYALFKLLTSGEYKVKSLHTVFDAELKRVGLHGVPEHLIEAQALALDIPLEKIYLPKDDSHQSYEEVIRKFCELQKSAGIEHVMYGDIFLEDLKAYRDKQLSSMRMQGVYPIWKMNTLELVRQFIDDGFKTTVCAANTAMFNKTQVGKTIDHEWIDHLREGVDPCGENGEFHSFVYDGPLFRTKVDFRKGGIVEKHYEYNKREDDGSVTPMRSGFWFQELL
ncbi:diphthine--ammonia ligase [Fulvivirga sp. 29W222]|uniref:Diphthine--ammonia ligase n=1 Tax=Fulvivirga marina TaxID=2494733 RepID=A0A937FVR3_9BACT|nr:diphthine--ammonia ligase [Fulvivirga marina]MBL6447025.1 diphthine--ammonia ligase [Fulvivirga marina]